MEKIHRNNIDVDVAQVAAARPMPAVASAAACPSCRASITATTVKIGATR